MVPSRLGSTTIWTNTHGAAELPTTARLARNWSNYVITAQGETHAAAAVSEVDGDVWQYLVRTVAWAKSLRFSELVGAIYRAYPDFARHSIFAPELILDDSTGRSMVPRRCSLCC